MWADGNVIGHLRVRGGIRDGARLRMAASRELDDGLALSLPPSAVLMVRKVDDPLPGRFASRHAPAWRAALRRQLTDIRDRAARPRGGRVPADAGSILFTDSAELAACLAWHCSSGGPLPWWCTLLRSGLESRAPADMVARVLAHEPRRLPAVLSYLADWGCAGAVVATVDETVACHLLRLVLQAHGLDDRRWARLMDPPVQADTDIRTNDLREREETAETPHSGTRATTPDWPVEVGRNHRALGREQGSLLAVALCLAREPAAMDRPGFRIALAEWRAAHETPGGDPAARRAPDPDPRGDMSEHPQHSPPAGPSHPADGPPTSAVQLTPGAFDPRVAPRTLATEMRAGGTPRAGADMDRKLPPVDRRAEPSPEPPDSEIATAAVPAWSPAVDGVPTRLGGALYLINVMRHFELPEALEPEWRFAQSLGAWGVLGLLARGFLGRRSIADDALWEVFDDLRGPAPPSADLAEARRWLRDALPRFKRRVRSATGRARNAAVSDLFCLPGRLYVTRTHVDMVASLDDVRLGARVAGLDRDPGWQPAFGRVIRFHFE